MKEIPWRRIPVTSSSKRTSMAQLGKRFRVKRGEGKRRLSACTPSTAGYGQIFKDDVNGFSSTSIICFLEETL
jgi:hypothetical protein